jgi:rRNA maturation RNase YbeY
MPVECRNAQRRIRLDVKALQAAGRRCLKELGKEGETVSIVLVDDEAMRGLHEKWMGSPVTTDVLSFPQKDAFSHSRLLGDVAISVETAARRNPRRLLEEVNRCLIHGILHLAGFDHRRSRDRDRMRREARHLEKIVQRVRYKA